MRRRRIKRRSPTSTRQHLNIPARTTCFHWRPRKSTSLTKELRCGSRSTKVSSCKSAAVTHFFRYLTPIHRSFKIFIVSTQETVRAMVENVLRWKPGDMEKCKGWAATEVIECGDGQWTKVRPISPLWWHALTSRLRVPRYVTQMIRRRVLSPAWAGLLNVATLFLLFGLLCTESKVPIRRQILGWAATMGLRTLFFFLLVSRRSVTSYRRTVLHCSLNACLMLPSTTRWR